MIVHISFKTARSVFHFAYLLQMRANAVRECEVIPLCTVRFHVVPNDNCFRRLTMPDMCIHIGPGLLFVCHLSVIWTLPVFLSHLFSTSYIILDSMMCYILIVLYLSKESMISLPLRILLRVGASTSRERETVE